MYSANPKLEEKRVDVRPVRILYVWALVFLAMAIYAVVWYMLGSVALSVMQAVEASFSFDPPWDTVTAFLKYCIFLNPVIAMIGWIIWGMLNSAKRDRETWQA